MDKVFPALIRGVITIATGALAIYAGMYLYDHFGPDAQKS